MRNLATLGQVPRIHPGSGNFGLGVKQCWRVVWQPGSAVFDAESGNFGLGRPDRVWIWQRALKLCSSGLKELTKKKRFVVPLNHKPASESALRLPIALPALFDNRKPVLIGVLAPSFFTHVLGCQMFACVHASSDSGNPETGQRVFLAHSCQMSAHRSLDLEFWQSGAKSATWYLCS